MFDDTLPRARRALQAGLALCGLLLATAATAQAVAPNLRLSGSSVLEGNTGTRTLVFTLTLDAAATRDVVGRFHTRPSALSSSAKAGATCTGDVDYIEVDQPFVIRAGTLAVTAEVTVCGDARVEPAMEYVYTSLYSVFGANCPSSGCVASGAIEEDDIPASITINAASSGRWSFTETVFNIPVQMNYPSGVPVTVNYRTREATANGSSTCKLVATDYESRSGTLTFAPGDKVAYIPVRVCKSQSQGEQTFWVDLSNPSGGGAFIFRGTAEMTLLPARSLGLFGLRAGELTVAADETRPLAVTWQAAAGAAPVRELAVRVRSGPLSVLWLQWSRADGLLRMCQRSAVRLGAYELHGAGSERLAADGESEGITLAMACSAGAAPGSRQTLETPLARLHLAGSRVTLRDGGAGEQVELTLAVSFKSGLQGLQTVELAATDAAGASEPFLRAGRLLLVPAGAGGR